MIDLQNIWPEWQIEELIGQGAYGKVYRIRRERMGKTSYAALKLIEIPADDAEVKNLLRLGMDNLSIRDYFTDTARAITDEISTMQDLQSASNVVIVEDYHLEEHKDGIGWTILIRMELLTSLPDYQREHGDPDAEETVKIGIDICKALESCESCRIIHRDVKPQNVFRNKFGDYKLGDFGIARKMEDTKSAYSQKGTEGYMAPEIVHGEKYDSTVDIYSLGIMLYEFLNGQRMPFLPTGTTKLKPSDFQTAMERRLSGEELPAPKEADPMLSKIILKACSANPQLRYRHAKQFREALEAWQEGEAGNTVELPQEGPVIKPVHWGGAEAKPHPVPEKAEENHETEDPSSEKSQPEDHSEKKTGSSGSNENNPKPDIKKWLIPAAAAAVLVIILIAVVAGKKKPENTASEPASAAESLSASQEELPKPIEEDGSENSDGEKQEDSAAESSEAEEASAPEETPAPEEESSEEEDVPSWSFSWEEQPYEEVEGWGDYVLEWAVRQVVSPQEEPFMPEDIAEITKLELNMNLKMDEDAPLQYIRDIRALSVCKNLTVLNLYFSGRVSDLRPLKEMNLHKLNLSGNKVADLTPLKDMTAMFELDLMRNPVTDLTPLSGMTNLQKLNISYMKTGGTFISIDPLKGMNKLERLYAPGTMIKDFTPLAGLKSLKDLTITLYRETDLTPLAEIDTLEEIDIDTPEKMDKNYAEKITEEAVTPLQELRPDLKIKVHIYE